VRICGCCVRIRAGISVRVRITVWDGVRISNRVRRRVKLVNYSLITALPIATSAYPLFTRGRDVTMYVCMYVCILFANKKRQHINNTVRGLDRKARGQ